VVALTDQWYLSYGDPEWVDKVSKHIHSAHFNGYNDKIMESFDHVSTVTACIQCTPHSHASHCTCSDTAETL
jgi:hypothetical protein